jgi:hypothetical protein
MPITKYRGVEHMPQENWLTPGDPAIARRIRLVCSRASTLAGPLPAPRGLNKYRSFEELHEQRERWEQERINSIRAERLRKS